MRNEARRPDKTIPGFNTLMVLAEAKTEDAGEVTTQASETKTVALGETNMEDAGGAMTTVDQMK